MRVRIWLKESSQTLDYLDAKNTYQKGDLFCVYYNEVVHKYPIANIWRIEESYFAEEHRSK